MNVKYIFKDEILIITPLEATLEKKDTDEFKEKVLKLATSHHTNRLVFNLSYVQTIGSSGLSTLLSLLRTLSSQGGEIKLAGMNKAIRTLFELVCMHKIFDTFNTAEEAVGAFKINSSSHPLRA